MNSDFDKSSQETVTPKPVLSFSSMKDLVSSEMTALATGEKLARVLAALDPDADNIDVEDRFAAFRPERPVSSLRDLALPKRENYPEIGDAGNRTLARLLNKLAALQAPDPFEAMRRPETGENVLHLPVRPEVAAENARIADLKNEGLAYKETLRTMLERELPDLFQGRQSVISVPLQNILADIPRKLTDGDAIYVATHDVINDIGGIGKLTHAGYQMAEAVDIRLRLKSASADAPGLKNS